MTSFAPEFWSPRWLLRMLVACSMWVGMSGCKSAPPKPLIAGITGYNFTAEGVQGFSVDDHGGSNLPPQGGGGALSCCISLPAEWSPDATVEVAWTIGRYTQPWEKRKDMTVAEESKCCWTQRTLRRTVPVERYGTEGGDVQFFFLANDEIQVWVYDAGPQDTGHPSQRGYPEKPVVKE